jgi:hypothetical protein
MLSTFYQSKRKKAFRKAIQSLNVTLVIVIKNPAGIVFAADSAATLSRVDSKGRELYRTHAHNEAKKIISLEKPHDYVAAITYGRATIDRKTPDYHQKEIESRLPKERISLNEIAEEFSKFFMEKWNQSRDKEAHAEQELNMQFCVGGFDKGKPYASAFDFMIPDKPKLREISTGDDEKVFRWVGGWEQTYVQLRIEKEMEQLPAFSISELADFAGSCIQEVIIEYGWDENGNTIVSGPVIVCTITANEGLKCFNAGL